MTFKELYDKAKSQPKPVAPATSFVNEVADLTKKTRLAVRRWLSGETVPDALTQDVLAKHFNCKPEELFPKA